MDRSALVRSVAAGLHGAGVSTALASIVGYARRSPGFQILSFHRVNDEADPFFPALSTEVFERRMEFVARAYRVLPLEDLVDGMRRGTLPRDALAITFDDGYRDNLTHAAPVLARLCLPATVFLATGVIGSSEGLWFDRLAFAFKTTAREVYHAPWGAELGLAGRHARLEALAQTLTHLKHLPEEDFHRHLDGAVEALAPGVGPVRGPMLSWDDAKALTGRGISLGAHTVSHPVLSRLARGRAEREIQVSRRMIQEACGKTPVAFAYPNGGPDDYDAATVDLVRRAGFKCAVTTRFGINTARTSPYELRRGGPWELDLPTFALKLGLYRLARA
jgi:peptidoglycan/xylan/chitin deacetylase (PgdA/CDA1 family)